MKKRILAFVCMLAIAVGALALGAVATPEQDGYYDVGYAKLDVNPWVQSQNMDIGIPAQYTDADGNLVDYTDAATSIMDTKINNPKYMKPSEWCQTPIIRVKLSGYGAVSTRLAQTIADDNGDGLIGVGDGVQLTCTTVTDDWGKTVMYITLDTIGTDSRVARDIKNAIVAAMGSDVIALNEIMVSGSHSHEAPTISHCYTAAEGTALRAYYDYYIARAVEAAQQAYENRTPATMSKAAIEGSAAMKNMGYTYSDGTGIKLNFVRHYDIHSEEKVFGFTTSTHDWVGGDNFGGSFSEENDTGVVSSQTTMKHVSAANETMNILQFTPVNGGKSTLLVQWQAHPSIMGSSSRTDISSDYINALRYRLEQNKTKFGGSADYNVGFWQGTGGNMNPASRISAEYTYTPKNRSTSVGWPSVDPASVGLALTTDGTTSTSTTQNRTYRNGLYGYILGKVALEALKNPTACDTGRILSIQAMMKMDRQKDSEGMIAAANAWKVEYDAGKTITYPYPHTYNGTTYALNSYYHAYYILERAKNSATYTNMELNAIVMGENVRLVTAPAELFDRYSNTGSFTDDDWMDLKTTATGEAFVLSLTNAYNGYVPNVMAYDYYTDQSGKVAKGTAMGSYEANSTIHKRGSGEEMIAYMGKMLDLAKSGTVTAQCPQCGEVEWTPVLADVVSMTNLGTGHFYLAENALRLSENSVDGVNQKAVSAGEKLCINLNGYTLESEGRSFDVHKDGELTIIDTALRNAGPGGVVRAYSGDNNPGGGVVTVAAGGVVNLYGGTLEFVKEDSTKYGTGLGGIFSLTGTLNMYGGTVKGAELVDSSYPFGSDGTGGAIYMYGGAKLNMYGGEIISGTVPTVVDETKAGKAPCVFVSATSCRILLSGDADVEDIYYGASNGSLLTVDGAYTGTAGLTMGVAVSEGMDIGNITNKATFPNLTCVSHPTYFVRANSSNLILTSMGEDVVAVTGSTGYTTLQDAIDGYTGTLTNYAIKLMADVEEDIVMNKGRTAVVNLNGFNIKSATVTSGKLMCMDAATDDFDVSDNMYGKILAGSGNIMGYNTDGSRNSNSYMMVNEGGALSFHAVNLRMSAMTLRPAEDGVSAPSVYYQSNFKADHIAAAKIKKYGVAMSTIAKPTTSNLATDCKMSSFTSFKAGAAGNSGNGTLLKGIMKPTNADLVNRRNANVPVYGAAYVLTDDGYLLGPAEQKTLVQQTEAIDAKWSTLTSIQKQGMAKMYDTYKSIVKKWNVPNLTAAMGPSQDGTLKVLVIGNSHGLDATNLLYEVFEDQGYDEQKLVLGALYYSGCNMSQHADFMTNSKANYDYYENDGSNADGSWDIQKGVVADVALAAHQWDIIILQQMNHRAANPSVYNATEFKTVINYVKNHQNGIPKFGWHMVWTNPDQDEYWNPTSSLSHPTKDNTDWKDTNDAWFPGADGTYDQALMYQKMVACTQTYIEDDKTFLGEDVFDFVIPSCTAVEYAQDELGLTQAQVYRDYTHMNDYGRLIAAYTWYAKIMELDQISAVGIDAIPAVLHHSKSEYPTAESGYAITPDMQNHIVECVNWALEHPYELP